METHDQGQLWIYMQTLFLNTQLDSSITFLHHTILWINPLLSHLISGQVIHKYIACGGGEIDCHIISPSLPSTFIKALLPLFYWPMQVTNMGAQSIPDFCCSASSSSCDGCTFWMTVPIQQSITGMLPFGGKKAHLWHQKDCEEHSNADSIDDTGI